MRFVFRNFFIMHDRFHALIGAKGEWWRSPSVHIAYIVSIIVAHTCRYYTG